MGGLTHGAKLMPKRCKLDAASRNELQQSKNRFMGTRCQVLMCRQVVGGRCYGCHKLVIVSSEACHCRAITCMGSAASWQRMKPSSAC